MLMWMLRVKGWERRGVEWVLVVWSLSLGEVMDC